MRSKLLWKYGSLFFSFLFGLSLSFWIGSSHAQVIETLPDASSTAIMTLQANAEQIQTDLINEKGISEYYKFAYENLKNYCIK